MAQHLANISFASEYKTYINLVSIHCIHISKFVRVPVVYENITTVFLESKQILEKPMLLSKEIVDFYLKKLSLRIPSKPCNNMIDQNPTQVFPTVSYATLQTTLVTFEVFFNLLHQIKLRLDIFLPIIRSPPP